MTRGLAFPKIGSRNTEAFSILANHNRLAHAAKAHIEMESRRSTGKLLLAP
jgi:hypothetical protein